MERLRSRDLPSTRCVLDWSRKQYNRQSKSYQSTYNHRPGSPSGLKLSSTDSGTLKTKGCLIHSGRKYSVVARIASAISTDSADARCNETMLRKGTRKLSWIESSPPSMVNEVIDRMPKDIGCSKSLSEALEALLSGFGSGTRCILLIPNSEIAD